MVHGFRSRVISILVLQVAVVETIYDVDPIIDFHETLHVVATALKWIPQKRVRLSCRPPVGKSLSRTLLRSGYAVTVFTSLAMAHMKAHSSRAMAQFTVWYFLPRATILRNRA